jgi:uncharacterized protein (DUF305 family)
MAATLDHTATATSRTIRRPPLPVMILLPVALLFLAAAIGWTLRAPTRPDPGSVDVGFAQDMISHHDQAVEMSIAELQTGVEPLARHFAQEIILSQRYEIGIMTAWLQEWGYDRADRPDTAMAWMTHGSGSHHNMAAMSGQAITAETMPGMASADEMDALRASNGRDTDARFLRLMKAHHDGGIPMAEDAAVNAKNRKVRDLASRIAKYQRVEVAEMSQAQQRLAL